MNADQFNKQFCPIMEKIAEHMEKQTELMKAHLQFLTNRPFKFAAEVNREKKRATKKSAQ